MKIIFVTLMIVFSLFFAFYSFTVYQPIKKILETEKPPERKTREEEKNSDRTRISESKRLPDVVIIGVKKSGTETLDNFLNHHPNIYMVEGENMFFSIDKLYRRGLSYLISTMPRARFTMENYTFDKVDIICG